MNLWDEARGEATALFHDAMNVLLSAVGALLTEAPSALPNVNEKVLSFVLGPLSKLFDVPPYVVDFIENGSVAKYLTTVELAGLLALQARLEALAGTPTAAPIGAGTTKGPEPKPDSVGAFPV